MYLLVKGCNGFGNLISILSYAYSISQRTDMTLVVDWTHKEWKLGFDKYFKLKGINTMSYYDFKTMINQQLNKDNKSFNLKIYPELFNNRDILFDSIHNIFPNIDKDNTYNTIFNPVLDIITSTDNLKKHNYDIYILTYNWLGYNNAKKLWDNIVLNPEINKDIGEKIKSLGIYNAMHVRHTDNKNTSCLWVTDYIKKNVDKKIYVATDNELILNICRNLHNNIVNFTHFYEKGKPLHIQEKTDEEKHQINIDTIRDMYILVNANELKITPIKTIPYMTTYSMLAMNLRN
jgi:hypothetical protein